MGPTLPPESDDLGSGSAPAPGRAGGRHLEPGDGLPAIGRETRSSRGRFPLLGSASACRLPGSGLHVAMACRFLCSRFRRPNRWGLDAIASRVADLRAIRPDAASTRPSWPGCWPWNGSRVASWPFPSWISRGRSPGRSVGRCTGRYPGHGGSRPPGSPGSLSTSGPSVGCLPVGSDRPVSSWRWRVGRISASPDSRPPGAWMNWKRAKLVSVGRTPGRSPVVTDPGRRGRVGPTLKAGS